MASTDYALFYNSQSGDRVYDADSFEYLLKKFFTTGVFTGDCQVTAYSGMTVKMGSGYCNVGGKVRFFASEQSFTLSAAHATYDRIDAIVIERNDSDRDITAKLVTGTAAATPVAPTPVRSGGVYQLVVAYVRVNSGAYAIVAADITDMRVDSTVCGYVVSACQTPSFSELYTQFTDAFNTWFDSMKDQLSEDAAGNLQLEIDDIKEIERSYPDVGGWTSYTQILSTAQLTCYRNNQVYYCEFQLTQKANHAGLSANTEYTFPITASFRPKATVYYTGSNKFKGVATWSTENVIKITPSEYIANNPNAYEKINIMFMFIGEPTT